VLAHDLTERELLHRVAELRLRLGVPELIGRADAGQHLVVRIPIEECVEGDLVIVSELVPRRGDRADTGLEDIVVVREVVADDRLGMAGGAGMNCLSISVRCLYSVV
jgi:hypothetical protein